MKIPFSSRSWYEPLMFFLVIMCPVVFYAICLVRKYLEVHK